LPCQYSCCERGQLPQFTTSTRLHRLITRIADRRIPRERFSPQTLSGCTPQAAFRWTNSTPDRSRSWHSASCPKPSAFKGQNCRSRKWALTSKKSFDLDLQFKNCVAHLRFSQLKVVNQSLSSSLKTTRWRRVNTTT